MRLIIGIVLVFIWSMTGWVCNYLDKRTGYAWSTRRVVISLIISAVMLVVGAGLVISTL